MDDRKDFRYSDNIEEHIHVMSFARELHIKNISSSGISFYNPQYEKGDIIILTITIPKILQIFNEKILIVSDENELYVRAKFISPSEEFITIFNEFMELKNENN